jgi:hypothetical protein
MDGGYYGSDYDVGVPGFSLSGNQRDTIMIRPPHTSEHFRQDQRRWCRSPRADIGRLGVQHRSITRVAEPRFEERVAGLREVPFGTATCRVGNKRYVATVLSHPDGTPF